MPSVEEEIASWFNSRPVWLKSLARRILDEGEVSPEFLEKLISDLIANNRRTAFPKFTASELPASSNAGARVELVKVGDLMNVNALADGGTLSFGEEGLTIIYGDNGTGKSGFARLIKDVVGARHKQEILPHAFSPEGSKEQHATITFRINSEDQTLVWPSAATAALRQVHFYDEACGDHYLVHDTELTYRPSVLAIFDRLVSATDALREAADRELAIVNTSPYEVPELLASTKAGIFASNLSADTTEQQIDAAIELPEEAERALAGLVQAEGRLQSTNPTREKNRLAEVAAGLEVIADHFVVLGSALTPAASREIEEKLENAASLRIAADLASKSNFADEPLEGIGSLSWRALWEAAEAYSTQAAYHEHEFPFIGEDARCPFCHQTLTEDAARRLNRFNAFVQDETAKKANDAEAKSRNAISRLKEIEVVTIATTNALASIETEDSDLVAKLRISFDAAAAAKKRISKRLRNETEKPPIVFLTPDVGELRAAAEAIRQRGVEIDATVFAEQLKSAGDAKKELKDTLQLAQHAEKLRTEVARLGKVRDITSIVSGISTRSITNQSTALTRTHVNEKVNDYFADECGRLGVEHVKLADKGGDKGKLRHKPALLGATFMTKTVGEVLSEGEQTALGLAGLLTELRFDDSGSALVLDDPITSLDHGRRERFAKRIAALAGKRQVIVFTHDLTFLGDLIRAADERGVVFQERSIVKSGDGVPGKVLDTHPWKAKDAKKRIGDLREGLAKLKREQADLSSEEYDDRVQLWAGRLSEIWERIVRNDVVGKVVDRGTTEVRPKMMKLLAQITLDDDTDFRSGYSQVSKWAPRHDKSEEVNFVAPTTDEMDAELDRVDSWYKRVVVYAQA